MAKPKAGIRYSVKPVPRTGEQQDVLTWAEEQFVQLQSVLEVIAAGNCDALNVAPAKPRTGMLRYADGTNWNPGSGKGYYGYDESTAAWRFLG